MEPSGGSVDGSGTTDMATKLLQPEEANDGGDADGPNGGNLVDPAPKRVCGALRPETAAADAAEATPCSDMAATGTIDRALAIMRAEPGDARVQQAGCSTLANLAFNNDAGTVAIAAQGGIEVVVAALTAHHSSADVQEYGCRALAYLAANNAANAGDRGPGRD